MNEQPNEQTKNETAAETLDRYKGLVASLAKRRMEHAVERKALQSKIRAALATYVRALKSEK